MTPLPVAGFNFDLSLISFFLTNQITSKVGKVQDTTKVKKNTANAKLEEMKNVNTDFASPKLN